MTWNTKAKIEKRAVPTGLNFENLLKRAVDEPGTMSKAYQAFHRYSVGNQIAAMFQCMNKGIDLGPINTFKKWKEMGRMVKKGEKAMFLCMPVTAKKKTEDKATGEEKESCFTLFVWRPRWFVLSQTQGDDAPLESPPDWTYGKALAALEITEVPFTMPNGNCQGYASKDEIAINPLGQHKLKTTFHVLAHVVLGHTKENTMTDGDETPRELREAEAECVAMVLCEVLDQPGTDLSRGYIQHWYGSGNAIPEKSARKIFAAANKILKAGQPELEQAEHKPAKSDGSFGRSLMRSIARNA